ncbi:unnamed protein product [Lactuca virosa]|uniref:Uncharacterized protein n=1 Tax=Lactuca virosa TaxID=75947 RepID=A0AAU9MSI5_9ASTR|nr:unnamed protein product [Lactuca virosa]
MVPDQNVDQMNVTPESPLSFTGFGSNAFSIEQLLGTYFPVIGSGQFLATEVNVCVSEVMNLASKEILVKDGEMYDDLSIRYQDATTKVSSLENQGTLAQAKYESCLQENSVSRSQLLNKS